MRICDWCHSTDGVKLRNREYLCSECRSVINFQNILSTTEDSPKGK